VLPFRGLFVCLSDMFMHCAQTAEAHDSAILLPDRVIIWLTSVNPFLPKFCPIVTPPVDLSIGNIRSQIAAEYRMVIDVQRNCHNGEPIGNHHLF